MPLLRPDKEKEDKLREYWLIAMPEVMSIKLQNKVTTEYFVKYKKTDAETPITVSLVVSRSPSTILLRL